MIIGGGVFLLLLALGLMLPEKSLAAVVLGYLLSYLFVLSNFFVVRKMQMDDQGRFLKLFFGALAVRFLVTLLLFAWVLVALKIDQIFFTVSFIISYIFYSIIEIIFINKILENRKNS